MITQVSLGSDPAHLAGRQAMIFPAIATLLVGVGHALAWRAAFGLSAWVWLAMAYAPILAWSLYLLRRDDVLGALLRPVAGDMTFGIMGAAVSIASLWGVAALGMRFMHDFVARDLAGVLGVAVAVRSSAVRAVAILAFATCEEVVWRGAVTHALEPKFGSVRAPWIASALFVAAVLPALFGVTSTASNELGARALLVHSSSHASLVAAAVLLAVVTAYERAKYRRLSVSIVTHAFFTWLVVEMMLPSLWARL